MAHSSEVQDRKKVCRRGSLLVEHPIVAMESTLPSPVASGGASEPAGGSRGGAAEPTDGMPMEELNGNTGKVGFWFVKVAGVKDTTYDYAWNGNVRTARKFSCVLVSPNASVYCSGVLKMRKGNGQEIDAAKAQFQKGSVWKLTNVRLASDEKKEYMHAPFKVVVDLRNSTFTPVLQSLLTMPSAPDPPSSVTDVLEFSKTQRFDLTALISKISDARHVTTKQGLRQVVDVTVLDGTKGTSGNVAEIDFCMWFSQDTAKSLEDLRELATGQRPVTFFALAGAVGKSGKVEVSTSVDFDWVLAQGGKADSLVSQAVELQSLPNKETLTEVWQPDHTAKDYLNCVATQSACELLRTGLQQNLFAEEEKLYQMNYVTLLPPPPGTRPLTKDGQRIYFRTTTSDFSGSVEVGVREKVALTLSGENDKSTFVEKALRGEVLFPMLCSVRVLLTKRDKNPTQGGASEPVDKETTATIVEAEEQSIEQAPTSAMLELASLLKHCAQSPNGTLPALLSRIGKSKHYGLGVHCASDGASEPAATQALRPCDKVLTLVASREQSVLQPLGEQGWRLVTENVTDPLQPSSPPVRLVAMCTLDTLSNYKLDPPRSGDKTQYALLLISNVTTPVGQETAKTLLVQEVQLLSRDERESAVRTMKRLTYLTDHTIFDGEPGEPRQWDEGETPERAKKCRRLSATPTDQSMPEDPQ